VIIAICDCCVFHRWSAESVDAIANQVRAFEDSDMDEESL
jgi:hypothetical protein